MFGIIKKMFIVLLASIVNASNHTKCVSLSNQKCKIQPILINLHPNEYNQELHYYPLAVKLDKCIGSCNTLNDLSDTVCVANKTEDLNIHVFNMITGKMNQNLYYINANVNVHLMEKNVIQINGGMTTDVYVSVKTIMHVKKILFGILLHVVAKMENI